MSRTKAEIKDLAKIQNFVTSLKENLKLLPNKITLIRYLVMPFLFYFAYENNLLWFTVLFYVAFISDQLDGIVARKLNQCSDFGSDMDAFADELYNLFAVAFLYLLQKQILLRFFWFIIPLLAIFLLDKIIHHIKFNSTIKLHLYSGKVYQRYFYVAFPLLIYTQSAALFYILFFIGVVATLERIAIYLKYKKLNKDMKSLIPLKFNIFYYIMRYWP